MKAKGIATPKSAKAAKVVEAKVVKAANAKPKKFEDKFRVGSIGRQTVELIVAGKLSNDEILKEVKKTHKDSQTTAACIAWYKSKCRKEGAIK